MAKQRIIDTKFWSDTYISNLEPIEKLVFLYLITNEKTNICGAYELPEKIMQIEIGVEKEVLKSALTKLVRDGKILYESGWIVLRNFIKYQNLANPKIIVAVRNTLDKIPLEIRKKLYRMDRVWIGYLYPSGRLSHLNLNLNLNLKSNLSPPTPSRGGSDGASSGTESEEKKGSLKKFVDECRKRPEPEFTVLADWAETVNPGFTTDSQWDEFVKRNQRPAKRIVPFTHDQVVKAFKRLQRAKEEGLLKKFTLEALWKEITNPTT